jgi:hypothetical protein
MRPEIAFVAALKKAPEDLQTKQGQCFAVLSLLCDGNLGDGFGIDQAAA